MSENDTNEDGEYSETSDGLLVWLQRGIIPLGAMILGYWFAQPSEERTQTSTLIEISTLIPLFAAIISFTVETGATIMLQIAKLLNYLKMMREYRTMEKAAQNKIIAEQEELIANLKNEFQKQFEAQVKEQEAARAKFHAELLKEAHRIAQKTYDADSNRAVEEDIETESESAVEKNKATA